MPATWRMFGEVPVLSGPHSVSGHLHEVSQVGVCYTIKRKNSHKGKTSHICEKKLVTYVKINDKCKKGQLHM